MYKTFIYMVIVFSFLLPACGDGLPETYYRVGKIENRTYDDSIWDCKSRPQGDKIYVECWKKDDSEMIWLITDYFEHVK